MNRVTVCVIAQNEQQDLPRLLKSVEGIANEIVVVDTTTLEAVKHIPDAQLPWGIVTYPKAAGSLDQVE